MSAYIFSNFIQSFMNEPKCENLSDMQIETIITVPGLEKFHNSIYNLTPPTESITTIIGGSFGLKLYTGLNFPVNDIDVISSALNYNSFKDKTSSITLFKEAKLIESIYPNTTITIKHVADSDLKDSNGNTVSVVSGMPNKEEFDDYIVGTVNVMTNPKIQYVFVNKSNEELETWYKQASDLPVYATIYRSNTSDTPTYMFNFRDYTNAQAAKNWQLHGIKHKYRQQKYLDKGFSIN